MRVSRSQMSHDTADRTVPRGHGTDIITALNNAVSAVPYRSYDTAAPAAAEYIRPVPAVDNIRAVAPSCDSSDKIPAGGTYFPACNSDIPNNGTVTDVAEKAAGLGIQIVNRIAAAVKNALKLLVGCFSDRHPVRVIAQIDIAGHPEIHTRKRFSSIHSVGQFHQLGCRPDTVRIFLRSVPFPRHFFLYFHGNDSLQRAMQNIHRAVVQAQLSRDGKSVIGQLLGVPVIVHRRHNQPGGIKALACIVRGFVRHPRNGNRHNIRLIRIQCRFSPDHFDSGSQHRIIAYIPPLGLRHRTEQRKRLLQACLVVRRHSLGQCLYGIHRRLPCFLRIIRCLRPHIVQRVHSVLKPPVCHQRVGCLIVGHGIPAAVQLMAKAPVRQDKAQQSVQHGLPVTGNEPCILCGINTERTEGHNNLRYALDVVRVPRGKAAVLIHQGAESVECLIHALTHSPRNLLVTVSVGICVHRVLIVVRCQRLNRHGRHIHIRNRTVPAEYPAAVCIALHTIGKLFLQNFRDKGFPRIFCVIGNLIPSRIHSQ